MATTGCSGGVRRRSWSATASCEAEGGNDRLIANHRDSLLHGDAQRMEEHARGGDDYLHNKQGDDTLYGDGQEIGAEVTRGADRFVFAKDCGRDVIGDFERNLDLIDLQRLGYTSFAQLTIHEVGGDSAIDLPGTNQVTVTGVPGLTAADFLLA